VKWLLAGRRLLTLYAPEGVARGCGKTRLALAVAQDLVEGFEEGVWWVELASLSDPTLVQGAVASTLGAREAPDRSLTEALVEHLKPRKTLLVLDNCEHLVEGCAVLADTLLRACPDLRPPWDTPPPSPLWWRRSGRAGRSPAGRARVRRSRGTHPPGTVQADPAQAPALGRDAGRLQGSHGMVIHHGQRARGRAHARTRVARALRDDARDGTPGARGSRTLGPQRHTCCLPTQQRSPTSRPSGCIPQRCSP